MKVPDKVKIGGYEVKVRWMDNLVTDRGHVGEYSPREQVIIIDKASTKQESKETFLHELLEAIKSIYGLELEHKCLSLLSLVLHQVIEDNPGIFKVED